jgi:transposase
MKLLRLTSDIFRSVERCAATDATGISTTCFSSWYSIQTKKVTPKRDHLLVHISIGTKSNILMELDIRTNRGCDNVIFRSHVKRIGKRFDIEDWTGDKYYLSRENCDAVAEIGAFPWFKPKSNTTARAKGSVAWKKMVHTFQDDPDFANKKYHQRSNVESTISAKKRKFGSSVKSRLPVAQVNEEYISWVGFNFSLLPRALLEFNVQPYFVPHDRCQQPSHLFYT